jgi:hypothetical protein
LESPGEDTDVIEGEIDEDPPDEDEEFKDSGYTDAEPDVIDVEIMEDDPGTTYPPTPDSSLSVGPGPFTGPPKGLMTLDDALEIAAQMRSRANSRSATANEIRCGTTGLR